MNNIYDYFKDKKDRFIDHNVFNGDGYEKICKFIGIDTLDNNYPKLKNKKV